MTDSANKSESRVNYPSKVLLFGEYTVIHGSSCLALPFHHFQCHFDRYPDSDVNRQLQKTSAHDESTLANEFTGYLDMLTQHYPHYFSKAGLQEFINDQQQGIVVNLNIPQGKGLGSSGSYCAAIFHRYFFPHILELNFCNLRKSLILLENFFHSRSSGIDPLVSYTGKVVFSKGLDDVELVEPTPFFENFLVNLKNIGVHKVWLIDSGVQRKTSPLVKIYEDQLANPHVKQQFFQHYIPLVNFSIQSLMSMDHNHHQKHGEKLQVALREVCSHQYQYFSSMFIHDFLNIAKSACENQSFYLKLCGAGGGGYYLAFEFLAGSVEQSFAHKYRCIAL